MVFINIQRDYPRSLGAQNLKAKTIVFLISGATSHGQLLQSVAPVLGAESARVYAERRHSC